METGKSRWGLMLCGILGLGTSGCICCCGDPYASYSWDPHFPPEASPYGYGVKQPTGYVPPVRRPAYSSTSPNSYPHTDLNAYANTNPAMPGDNRPSDIPSDYVLQPDGTYVSPWMPAEMMPPEMRGQPSTDSYATATPPQVPTGTVSPVMIPPAEQLPLPRPVPDIQTQSYQRPAPSVRRPSPRYQNQRPAAVNSRSSGCTACGQRS